MTPRRRSLLGAGLVALSAGVLLILLGGGTSVTNFLPGDPLTPDVAFSSTAGAGLAVEIGPTSFPATEGIEIRTGSESLNGRVLWKVSRTTPSPAGTAATVVIGEVPDGFEEVQALEGELPELWHAEIDNRCYFGSGVAPRGDVPDGKVLVTDPDRTVSLDEFRTGDLGFSPCDDSTFADRAPSFFGLMLIGVGGVLLVLCWWDWRRGLPTELGGDRT